MSYKLVEGSRIALSLYNGDLAGVSFGTPMNMGDLPSIYRLGYRADQSFHVSDEFREATQISAPRYQKQHLYLKGYDARFVQRLQTKDAGMIPVLYGCVDLYPAYSDEVHENSVEFFEGTDIKVVDDAFFDYVIKDLNDGYTLPRNVRKEVASSERANHYFTIRELDETDMYRYATAEPQSDQDFNAWINAHIHTRLHFAGYSIENAIDARMYENMFMDYHNMNNLLMRDAIIHAAPTNKKFAVFLNDELFGAIDVNVHIDDQGNEQWHWCNTHRIRFGYDGLTSLTYNVNTVILAKLIDAAQAQGVEALGLGQGIGYEYKERFKPTTVWKKGLRYD